MARNRFDAGALKQSEGLVAVDPSLLCLVLPVEHIVARGAE